MHPKILIILLSLVTLASSVDARIGDRNSDLQRRLVSSNLGREYPKDKLPAKWNQFPYHSILQEYQDTTGDRFEYGAFWKTHDGKRITNIAFREEAYPAGWDLHVMYKGGRSIFEAYRRNGSDLNQFEINGLLAMNQGDSHWQEAERGTVTALGVTYQRADGLLRAHVRRDRAGQFFIVYLTSLDEELVKVRTEMRKAREEEQAQTVNDSLFGF